jgi:predicted component of type VI protein secretion system
MEFINAVRLLENAAKEMGNTALRDKPEKESFPLGKTSLCLEACVQRPDSTRCCVIRLRLL